MFGSTREEEGVVKEIYENVCRKINQRKKGIDVFENFGSGPIFDILLGIVWSLCLVRYHDGLEKI